MPLSFVGLTHPKFWRDDLRILRKWETFHRCSYNKIRISLDVLWSSTEIPAGGRVTRRRVISLERVCLYMLSLHFEYTSIATC